MRNALLALILLAGALGACQAAPTPPGQPDGLPHVVAVESFLADIAQNVAGDRLKVATLIPLGVDPHEYQPTPQDTVRLAGSQVLIVNGIGYEAWLQRTLANVGSGRLVIVASAGLTPTPDPTGTHPEGDPHMWLDPQKVVVYVENIRAGLAQADPAGAQVYARNAAAYTARLADLDGWIKSQVSQVPPQKRALVTNHESLGYFAQAYGFKVVGAVVPSLSSDASPTARQMAALVQAIQAGGVKTIFLEIGANPSLAQQIAAETGSQVVADLYLETLSPPDGPAATYLAMLTYDVNRIVNALK